MQHAAGSSRAYFRRTMDQMRAMDPLGAGWTALVLLLLCAALAWVQITAPRQWALLLHSFASLRLGKQRVGAELDLSNRNLALLLAVAIMATGLFAHGYSFLHGWTPAGPGTFLGFVLAIAALVTARLLLLRAISGLAGMDGGLGEYASTVVVLDVVLGLALLPLATVMAWPARPEWRDPACSIGLVLASAVLAFRWVRAVASGLGHGTPVRYVFLYLCAAEALPFALVLQRAGVLHQ
jgi:hypothetical protein